MLWRSTIGEITRSFIRQLNPSSQFPSEEIKLRDRLNEYLGQGLEQPGVVQVMIATFLFSPPGLFSIQGPERYFPSWLLNDYINIYNNSEQAEPELLNSPRHGVQASQDLNSPSAPDFGKFPAGLNELNNNRLQLNRMLGLANLYYIDPEDQEIRVELENLRQQFSQAILNCEEAQLQSLWEGDLGDRYWAIVRSGIQKETLNSQDQTIKDQISHRTHSFNGRWVRPAWIHKCDACCNALFRTWFNESRWSRRKAPCLVVGGYKEIFAKPLEATS